MNTTLKKCNCQCEQCKKNTHCSFGFNGETCEFDVAEGDARDLKEYQQLALFEEACVEQQSVV